MQRAKEMVEQVTAEPIVGEIYEGEVKSTTAFGAFIEIMPGTEGLLHISEIQHGRTERVEDVLKRGDVVRVKLIERDERGKMRLSRKALLEKPEGTAGEGGSGGEGELAGVGGSGDHSSEDRPRRPRSSGGSGGRGRSGGGGRGRPRE